jgi:hypothetical protein
MDHLAFGTMRSIGREPALAIFDTARLILRTVIDKLGPARQSAQALRNVESLRRNAVRRMAWTYQVAIQGRLWSSFLVSITLKPFGRKAMSHIDAYKRNVEETILPGLRRDLQPLESGAERRGKRGTSGRWMDTTQDVIREIRLAIVGYERVLRGLRN